MRLVTAKVALDRSITACIGFPWHCFFTKASYPFTDLPRQATKPHQLRTSLNKHIAFFRQFEPLHPYLHVNLVLNIGLQIQYSNALLLESHRCSSFQHNGYRVFPGGKLRPGRDANPSPPSSTEVKNRVELYLYSP